MTIDREDLLNSILKSLDRIEYIKLEDIPNIDLYMDQVTTFMEEHLRSTVRYPGEDKILTKTMINNYAKNNLLPPPVKKKYSKEHVLLLIFIYYYKGILTINDIQALLNPLTDLFFQKEGFNLGDIYSEVFGLESKHVDLLKEDMKCKFKEAESTFQDAPEKERDFLRLFSIICMLSFDVYVKKLLIEKLVDSLGLLPGKGIRKAGSKKVISSRKAICRVGGPALGSGLSAKAWGHFWGVLGRVSRHWGKQGIIWIILAGMISELARKWETRRYAVFMGVYRFCIFRMWAS